MDGQSFDSPQSDCKLDGNGVEPLERVARNIREWINVHHSGDGILEETTDTTV